MFGERRRHERVWEAMRVEDAEGLTKFQVVCERKLLEEAAASGVTLTGRQARVTSIKFVEWRFEGTPLTIGIYPNGASVWGPGVDDHFEEWDTRTPEELIDLICACAVRGAKNFQAGA